MDPLCHFTFGCTDYITDPNSPVVLKSVKKRAYEEDEDEELPEPHIE